MPRLTKLGVLSLLVCASCFGTTWYGTLSDEKGRPLVRTKVAADRKGQPAHTAITGQSGEFILADLVEGSYSVTVESDGRTASTQLDIAAGERLDLALQLASPDRLVLKAEDATGAGVGQRLSSSKVSALPLNKRDFSQLLLLASGAQTDTNGAANFTAQFAVNGQRGTAAVFAMDGVDTSDPELGGATFSNFNVDAIEEIRSDSGSVPADIGHGAASFTNVITKSGTNQVHGAIFEFVRNAAFDARNFFDRQTVVQPGRIPPFQRNEFGFTSGGPVVLPGYNGRNRTFFFGQYQGFRQMLSTTQVLSVPSAGERRGLDTTAFPGDTLFVPVDPRVAGTLDHYPLPNDPRGPYGARTYAASSRVITNTDQFSLRIDHRISEKHQIFARFILDNINGPLTNPAQAAIDPSYAAKFRDRQRNAGLTYTGTLSPRLILETTLGYERSAPIFRAQNQTQPGLIFADALYEPINSTAGNVTGDWANLFQARQTVTYIRGKHTFKAGFEVRANRDSAVFGLSPNGLYSFGGGTSYSPVAIRSASGTHDIAPGDPLPDTLSSLLTASPFSYALGISPPMFPQGQDLGLTGIRRESYNAFLEDTWKATSSLTVTYGLRYELNTPLREPTDRASGPAFVGSGADRRQAMLVNLQPTFHTDRNGWGPRLGAEWRTGQHMTWHASGAIVTLLPNIYQTNFITSTNPFLLTLYMSAARGAPLTFQNIAGLFPLPQLYQPNGQPLFATGRTTDVAPNTEWDLQRFENDLAALTPDHKVHAIAVNGVNQNFRNGYTGSYSLGFNRDLGDLKLSASYIATVGVGLPAISFPNGYGGAQPGFAPYTKFDASGNITGGYGPEQIISNRSHSSYHSLQTGVQKTSPRWGIGFQASYTWSKSLDDASSIVGQSQGISNGVLQSAAPQNPFDTRAEKGPSTFDIRNVFTSSLVQVLPFDRWAPQKGVVHALTSGWSAFGVITLTSGSPFTIYSGVQQTGVGAGGGDRPDQIGQPALSVNRTVREDYFGSGSSNASYFFIPVGIANGSGPNSGRFGALGRNTFRGPAFRNFDFSLMKETPLRGDTARLQFRAEMFNVFNLVNFGLPANIVNGPGFGVISHTAGTSRQIQFSLKVLY